ncbi:MAG: hypothetical protein P4N59_06700 [Negativicutes bacterium]|nr:hypothetical protein [Negativicutes bacterium]
MRYDYGYLIAMFKSLPVASLIIDAEGTVLSVNNALKQAFGVQEMRAPSLGGIVLNCLHQNDDPGGCGKGKFCPECIIRKTVVMAIADRGEVHRKGKFSQLRDGEVKELTLLVSAAFVPYGVEQTAVVTIEDVSNVTILQGLLPLCSSCKKIRDTGGLWRMIDRYVQENSEIEFTHDVCPECSDTLMSKWRKTEEATDPDPQK